MRLLNFQEGGERHRASHCTRDILNYTNKQRGRFRRYNRYKLRFAHRISFSFCCNSCYTCRAPKFTNCRLYHPHINIDINIVLCDMCLCAIFLTAERIAWRNLIEKKYRETREGTNKADKQIVIKNLPTTALRFVHISRAHFNEFLSIWEE